MVLKLHPRVSLLCAIASMGLRHRREVQVVDLVEVVDREVYELGEPERLKGIMNMICYIKLL